MNCRDIEHLLLAEPDGVLTTEQHATLERHVAACPACQQMRVRITEAMAALRTEAAGVAIPDIENEWLEVRAKLQGKPAKPAKKRPLASAVIWFGAPLAAAAALAFAFFSPQQQVKPVVDSPSSSPEIAQAEYVETGDTGASTLVYVDKESGWLVVWATDNDTVTKS